MHDDHPSESPHGEIHLPGPSIWPVILGLGAAVLVTGVVFRGPVLVLGLLIFLAGIIGWIFEDDIQRWRGHA